MSKIFPIITLLIYLSNYLYCQNNFYEDGSFKEIIRYNNDSSISFVGASWKDTLREFANIKNGHKVGEAVSFFGPVSDKNHIIYEYYDNNGNDIYCKFVNYTTHKVEKEHYAELLDENVKLKNIDFEIKFWYIIEYHPNGKMASKGHYIAMIEDTFELRAKSFPSLYIEPYGIHYEYDTNGVYHGKRYIPKHNTIKYTILTYDKDGIEYYNTYNETFINNVIVKDKLFKWWDKNGKLIRTYEVDAKGNHVYREWNGIEKLIKTEKYDKNGFEIK